MIGEIPDDKRTALYVEEGNILDDNARSACTTRSLLTTWWNDAAWPGMGLFGESYILFSIGLMKPFWTILYPECFAYQVCSPRLLGSLTYSVVLGVITGMILLGYSANLIGRRIGGITTASFMCAGAIGLALVSFIFTDNPNLLFGSTSILLFVFGVGIGGEYPMSSSTATEKAMGEMKQNLKIQLQREAARKSVARSTTPKGDPHYTRHLDVSGPSHRSGEASRKATRGRAVQLVFMSQGIGILVNCLSLVFLLLLFGQYGSNVEGGNYTPDALLAIWRIVYSFGAFVLTAVLVSRLRYLKESSVWTDDKERREGLDRGQHGATMSKLNQLHPPQCSLTESEASEPSAHSVGDASSATECMPIAAVRDEVSASPTDLLIRYFGWRMIGSSMAWFFWDVAFYGNKLFQTTFLLALAGEETSLLQLSGAAALNAFVALLGYMGAAFLLDHPQVGRLRLQQYGFLITGALFVACGFLYDRLASGWLILMYVTSSFVGQLGPNATTFLIPSEIFPTEVRTQCHGIAAASGKLGALFAAVAFNYIGDVDMFLVSGYASFAACLVTFWTIPDVTTLDLHEIDRLWSMTLDGRRSEYVGDANSPKYLSYYERTKLGTY